MSPMHICGFFDSKEQQYEVIIPYIMEGLAANDKVINILEGDRHGEHCRRLASNGISISEKMASGQLEILASEDTYIKGDEFTADRMMICSRKLYYLHQGPDTKVSGLAEIWFGR